MTEPVFRPPLILDARMQRGFRRWRDFCLTFLLWLGWAYLLLAAIGTFWLPPSVRHLLPAAFYAEREDALMLALACLGAAAIICALMFCHAQLDRRRFVRDRRRSSPPAELAEVAARFGVAEIDLRKWQNQRRLIIHHTQLGHIGRVEDSLVPQPGCGDP